LSNNANSLKEEKKTKKRLGSNETGTCHKTLTFSTHLQRSTSNFIQVFIQSCKYSSFNTDHLQGHLAGDKLILVDG